MGVAFAANPEHDTNGITGWCLEANALAISKYVAGGDKERRFTAAMTSRDTLEARLAETELGEELRRIVAGRIRSDFTSRRERR